MVAGADTAPESFPNKNTLFKIRSVFKISIKEQP